MRITDLLAGGLTREPMSVSGDEFYATVTPNGNLVSRYMPADSTDKYTQVRRTKRVVEYHSYDIVE